MGIHGTAVSEIIVAPQAVQQVVPGEHFFGVGGQQPEQFLFPFGKRHFFVINGHHIVIDINGQIGNDQLAGFALFLLGDAPQDRPGPGHDLRRAEGLDDIIVGADIQPHDFIRILTPGRNHDHRHLRHGPDGFAHGKPVFSRHHNVQEHNGDLPGKFPEQPQRFFAVIGHIAAPAFFAGVVL